MLLHTELPCGTWTWVLCHDHDACGASAKTPSRHLLQSLQRLCADTRVWIYLLGRIMQTSAINVANLVVS